MMTIATVDLANKLKNSLVNFILVMAGSESAGLRV